MNILGLDISTSCVGITVLNENETLVIFDYVKPIGDTIFEKINSATIQTSKILSNTKIDYIIAEMPNIAFSVGKSSAQVISTVLRFNGAFLSYCYQNYTTNITEIMAVSARKAVTGRGRYEDVKNNIFDWVNNKIQYEKWPLVQRGKNKGKYAKECYDLADSFILAQYGYKLYCKN